MLRRFWMPLLALLLLLSACASQPPAVPTEKGLTDTPPLTSAPKPSATPLIAATSTKTPGCTVASLQPTAGPTQQSLFPTTKEGDQVVGPDVASVTIIEYADFQ